MDGPETALEAPRQDDLERARGLVRDGRFDEAAAVLGSHLDVNPESAEAWSLLGYTAAQRRRFEDAIEPYEKAVKLSPDEEKLRNLGSTYVNLGRWEDAEFAFRRAFDLRPDNADTLIRLAVVQSKGGRLDNARFSLLAAAGLDPRSSEPWRTLGELLEDAQQSASAANAYQEALKRDPASAAVWIRLGGVLRKLNQVEKALEAFEKARDLTPARWEAHANVGFVLQDLRRFADASTALQKAVDLGARTKDIYSALSFCLLQSGQAEDSFTALRRALVLNPTKEGFVRLGEGLLGLEQYDEALVALRRALEFAPTEAESHRRLGDALRSAGRPAEACVAFRTALAFDPESPQIHHSLGMSLAAQSRYGEARTSMLAALERAPQAIDIRNNFGNVLREFGVLEEACDAYRGALEIRPDYQAAMTNLATTLKDQGKLEESLECYDRAIAINPEFTAALGNYVYALNYLPGMTLPRLLAEHRKWDEKFGVPLLPKSPVYPQLAQRLARSPRLGFVSADFNNHPVGYFTVQILETLRERGVDFVSYSNSPRDDELTGRFKRASPLWRSVVGSSDEKLAQVIQQDEVDVLFDMNGFMAGGRMQLFARKPAPVQVTWFGYMATTGLRAMDYILADGRHIPVESEQFYSEKVLRMPHSLVVFDPPREAPPVSPLPAKVRGHVTFGSFNVLCKITLQVVVKWARILKRTPGSKLVMKTSALNCPATRARYVEMFRAEGVDSSRLIFQGRTSRYDHMSATASVDIALDPFPYVGCTTTVECAYMGVPVVTVPGELFSGRHSLSMLTTIGATETIAADLDEYEEIAVGLAHDLDRLSEICGSLRARMLASKLCDAASYTSEFIDVFDRVWRDYANSAH